MQILESDRESNLSVSPDFTSGAGPSSMGHISNGHTKGNGFSSTLNGSSNLGNGIHKSVKSIAKVSLPGKSLYDDQAVDREEFVRLVIQSLRDVGYTESAATLEAESGYSLESPEVARFRQYILDGSWSNAEATLMYLIVDDDEALWESKFLISQQKYLELLEAQKTNAALQVLRNELASLNVDSEQLHSLSSLIMCADPNDLRQRAAWDGASGTSRIRLLTSLQRHIPPSVMIPPRRFSALFSQVRSYQTHRCVYHNVPMTSTAYSLYTDHQCDKNSLPRITTTILKVHTDEVWNLTWSHSGAYLASASKDQTAIIWRIGPETEPSIRDYSPELILKDHPFPVGCLAWSLDDSCLLTSADNFIKVWNTKSGLCIGQHVAHTETVTALIWLPDNSGFISGGLDRKIIIWDADGNQRDSISTAIRMTDMAITPDFTRVVAIGMNQSSPTASATSPIVNATEHQIVVYDLATKQVESSLRLDGELTSVKISQDSQYALINHAPDEVHLYDIGAARLVQKFFGQRQGHHIIRSCFGGINENFVVSGSEDANVYIWHRDTGVLLEVLPGHGTGSVNSVAWNPTNERMLASCSDDHCIRIWEGPSPEMLEAASNSTNQLDSADKGKGKIHQRWEEEGIPSSTPRI